VQWSVLLCRFQDSGTGGLADFLQTISYGSLNPTGSVVKGWYTEPLTIAQAQAKSGGPNPQRGELITDCINAARNDPADPYTIPPGHRVAVITDPDIDLFGGGGGALLPSGIDVGGMSHEVGHGIELNHSFSDDPNYRNAEWSAIGEYDDQWDLMSYANVFGVATAQFGFGGPGLNAHHLDRMGWIPRSRILTFGADGAAVKTVTLAALNHPEAPGHLLVRIPFNPADPFHYYTVEFRKRDGWDGGIPASIVMIHEIKKRPDQPTGAYHTFLLKEHTGVRSPLASLDRNGVSIRVDAINEATNQATVTVSSQITDRCLQGFVWREANPADHVCVTPDIRQQVRDDNAQAGNRRDPTGPFGPNTCIQGFVWREAFPGDLVCVTPDRRQRAQDDNAQAASRINPARFVFGPNTCIQGFVWREADDSDYVCVTPDIRQQVRDDNALAAGRRNPTGPFGPNTCIQGFVWREAFPGDLVCVTPDRRQRALEDNTQASNRLQSP
jgi:hypothetical protein